MSQKSDIPINPDTNEPYFEIIKQGWSEGSWSVGNTVPIGIEDEANKPDADGIVIKWGDETKAGADQFARFDYLGFAANDLVDPSDMLGKTITQITMQKDGSHDYVIFHIGADEAYSMCHYQDCCESVSIESIVGELKDLIGSPILRAELSQSKEDGGDGHITWSFYKFATIKGYVDMRWCGESNGYYSEEVEFEHWYNPKA